MGQVVGESAEKVDVPKTSPVTPQDLIATVFKVLGIEQRILFTNQSGRPTYLVEHSNLLKIWCNGDKLRAGRLFKNLPAL